MKLSTDVCKHPNLSSFSDAGRWQRRNRYDLHCNLRAADSTMQRLTISSPMRPWIHFQAEQVDTFCLQRGDGGSGRLLVIEQRKHWPRLPPTPTNVKALRSLSTAAFCLSMPTKNWPSTGAVAGQVRRIGLSADSLTPPRHSDAHGWRSANLAAARTLQHHLGTLKSFRHSRHECELRSRCTAGAAAQYGHLARRRYTGLIRLLLFHELLAQFVDSISSRVDQF